MSDIDFIQTDTSEIQKEILENLESSVQEELYPGDERRIFAEAIAYVLTTMVNAINEACKKKLVRYATGDVLEAIGEMFDCGRQAGAEATVTLRFGVTTALDSDITIPAGTRVTSSYDLYFLTDTSAALKAGELYVDVQASAEAAGESYNGIAAGSLNILVDQVPYIDYVQNTEATSGGTDEEDDDAYRERILLAPSSWSTAGPKQAYEYWALSADSSIIDVSITSPSPGEVQIIPLCTNGTLPSDEIIRKVQETCSADDVRPLTDQVIVTTPETVSYDIEIVYYTTAADESACVETVEGEDGAIARYKRWQGEKLGRNINPDYLRKLVLAPSWEDGVCGAARVKVLSPEYTDIGNGQVAVAGEITVTHLIEEDDG